MQNKENQVGGEGLQLSSLQPSVAFLAPELSFSSYYTDKKLYNVFVSVFCTHFHEIILVNDDALLLLSSVHTT